MKYIIMLLIVVGAALTDFLTGYIKAYNKGEVNSRKMRIGGLNKVCEVLVMGSAIGLNIGLEKLGVLTNRGAIVTDETGRTNVPGVWAAGDVNGKSMLAHTAYREGEAAVNTMLGKKDRVDYRAIPAVIYTKPEVGCVGETVESTAKVGIKAKEYSISLRYSGRYVAENEGGDGIAKIVVDEENDTILGVHMIGSYASEIIYGAAAMIARHDRAADVRRLVFPHPTVCEVIREGMFMIK